MQKIQSLLFLPALFISLMASAQEEKGLEKGLTPLVERVNVQTDTAELHQVIDQRWVAVGIPKPSAICRDHTRLFNAEPSVRFTLGVNDNTLSGYSKGETKGRAEFSYCYATSKDFEGVSSEDYQKEQIVKTVYHHGKGITEQASKWSYTFSIYVPGDLSREVSTIFAQWHGMPDRTLVTTPDGEVKRLSIDEFVKMADTVVIKKDKAYTRIDTGKKGKRRYKAGEPTGWKIEQGGYPPLAFGFSGGWFYIKANSDRRWFTDKSDRCNASAAKYGAMQSEESEFKTSTIAYREAFEAFPKNQWVTFNIEIDWTKYSGEDEKILEPGRLDVVMEYEKNPKKASKKISRHIVNNETILIGRNDKDGYYFKYGIYRVGGSSEPVSYNLAGFKQWQR